MASSDRDAQPFSSQTGGQQRKTIGKFVEAFESAGHDLGALFAHFLEHTQLGAKQGQEARQGIKEALRETGTDADKTLDQLMDAIRELHSAKTTNDREKLRIMSLVAPIFTRSELLRRGFKVSNDAFANARKHATNVGAGEPVPVGGRPRQYPPEMAVSIEEFCNSPEHSSYNTLYAEAFFSLDPNSYTLDQDGPMMEVPAPVGDNHYPNEPVLIPANLNILSPEGTPILPRVLRQPISVIYHAWLQQHPEAKVTYQAFRSMLPVNIGKRSREGEDADAPELNDATNGAPSKSRKRSRPTAKMTTSMDPNTAPNIMAAPSGSMETLPPHLTMDPVIDHHASNPTGPISQHDPHLTHELVHHLQPVGQDDEEAEISAAGGPMKKRSKMEEKR